MKLICNHELQKRTRKRTVRVVLHGVEGSCPHEARIAGAPERSRLSGKYQPGARGADAHMRTLRGRDAHFSRSRSGPGGGGLRRCGSSFALRACSRFSGSSSSVCSCWPDEAEGLRPDAFRLLESTLQVALRGRGRLRARG